MMGRREAGQGQFFYSFDLDKVVPPDHLVRQIDGLLDLSWVHQELAPYYSHTGRPSIDPVLARAFPDKIDRIQSWSGMQSIQIGRSWSETKQMATHKLSTVYAACLREYAAILRSIDLSLAKNCSIGFRSGLYAGR